MEKSESAERGNMKSITYYISKCQNYTVETINICGKTVIFCRVAQILGENFVNIAFRISENAIAYFFVFC